jgi:hypothetical protein
MATAFPNGLLANNSRNSTPLTRTYECNPSGEYAYLPQQQRSSLRHHTKPSVPLTHTHWPTHWHTHWHTQTVGGITVVWLTLQVLYRDTPHSL